MRNRLLLSATLATTALLAAAVASPIGPGLPTPEGKAKTKAEKKAKRAPKPANDSAYAEAIQRTARMTSDAQARQLAGRHGLDILNITWEDTGRFKNSSVGPNISDMTIQVETPSAGRGERAVTCMPVIRFPNFSDKTCDIDPRDFTLLVGNQKPGSAKAPKRISLHDFLENPTRYLSDPDSWEQSKKARKKKERPSLLAPERDSRVLVSAQACFLPVPEKGGEATFNPVLFNYQSSKNNPAVLTVLATPQGTSTTIIDNHRDGFSTGGIWGQRLFFNHGGERASLTGSRQSEILRAEGGKAERKADTKELGNRDTGLNMVLLIQIPLKHENHFRGGFLGGGEVLESAAVDSFSIAPGASLKSAPETSNVENAVIRHGEVEGPFTEIDGLPIERDPRFPVRVTVQFYKATSNGIVSAGDMASIKEQIDRIYEQSDSVGSLVTGGHTGRITEYHGVRVQTHTWWRGFWHRHETHTHIPHAATLARLQRILGQKDIEALPVSELYLRDLLRKKEKKVGLVEL